MPVQPDRRARRLGWGALLLALLLLAGAVAWDRMRARAEQQAEVEAMTGGSIARGRDLFSAYGCGGCHSIGGVPQATGQVGPPLERFGSRAMIAGRLENRPDNLERWIIDPQAVAPGTAMPRLGVTPPQARDITAFIYSRS